MTDEELDQIEARAEAATEGPWAWRGHDTGSIELRALHSGGLRIVTTTRSDPCLVLLGDGSGALTASACEACREEATRDSDPFVDYRCSKPENLDTIWLRGEYFVQPANEWAVRERPYRSDVERVDHPDAEFIAHAREDIPKLLAEVRELRRVAAELVGAIEGTLRDNYEAVSRIDPRELEVALHSYREVERTRGVVTARVVYTDEVTGAEQVEVGDHVLQCGAPGDGYCYGHQSFDCIDNLTAAERVALSES